MIMITCRSVAPGSKARVIAYTTRNNPGICWYTIHGVMNAVLAKPMVASGITVALPH